MIIQSIETHTTIIQNVFYAIQGLVIDLDTSCILHQDSCLEDLQQADKVLQSLIEQLHGMSPSWPPVDPQIAQTAKAVFNRFNEDLITSTDYMMSTRKVKVDNFTRYFSRTALFEFREELH